MSGIFGYSREAVRVKVKKCEGLLAQEFRKFSVDPQITSFEVLQSILGKAFDIKGEFTICYRMFDVQGHEIYLPLLSDWDLDAAFLKAHNTSVMSGSEACLCLRVDMKPFEESSEDWDGPSTVSVITQFRTGTAQEVRPSPRLPGLIMNQVEKTFSMMQRAFNLGDDGNVFIQPPRLPLSDSEFRKFLDPVGQISHTKELRSVIYLGGIDPSLRKVVWKHILNVYPEGMTGKERMDYIKRKAIEYISLRDAWKDAVQKGPVTGDLAYTTGMVRKDVLRTDRHHKFYAGSDDNQNIASLFNILTTYALNHPKVSYCQGMSDLASPLLVTMGDEAHAYICFCALMSRLNNNFMLDGIAMTQKFTHLAEGLMFYDSEFYNYLKIHQADDLLFCYRWLLLEMKREFAFEDSLRMLEVLWSSLPAAPPEDELPLFENRFFPQEHATPPISPLVKTTRENAYTKVCALRRQTSSLSLASYTENKASPIKRQNFSLDETTGRLNKHMHDMKYRSLDDAMVTLSTKTEPKTNVEIRPRSVSPLEPKSDSVVLNNRINTQVSNETNPTLSSSLSNLKATKKAGHFKELKDKIASTKLGIFSSLDKLEEQESEKKPMGKMVKNLNEFLNFASIKKNSSASCSESDNPAIILTPTTDSSLSKSTNESTSDDLFDGSSPDDSQEYFPMTTSMTRELRLELENLDRHVFGNKYNQITLVDSSCSSESSVEDPKTKCDCIVSKSDVPDYDTVTEVAEIGSLPKSKLKSKTDDIFIWENPLHQTNNLTFPQTPDEQADIEFDGEPGEIVDESRGTKLATPIKLVRKTQKAPKKQIVQELPESNDQLKVEPPRKIPEINVNGTLPQYTNACEEVTENIMKSSFLPAPSEFGGGNPFLMFLCITVLLQHREIIIRNNMDYNEMAMHFDKMVRKHNVNRVLNQARQMYAGYMKQYSLAQQNSVTHNGEKV